ncbi:Glutathione-dependent formaldehyde-activating enzyme [Aspergillus sclerotialis]|uniref:Glutathione-dependent formaldehyde-activating enzyme n=1 Tax=Aspergillus sclerotialis TaxID=2070753 RepID=A0A3A2ZJP3_9EURO|nr:Glutathione-dependent formaldehyde-activating enzyme [Aspergillus sclerotialis]
MSIPPAQTSERSTHRGNCHCGAVRFTFSISPPLPKYPTNTCNCSICSKNGYLLVYPFTKDFTLETGKEVLRKYMFGLKRSEHKFCGTCGCSCFIEIVEEGAPDIIAVNVRLLEDFDYDILKINKVDGKTFGPEYKV